MQAELIALAASGATTLVTLMISDAWGQTKERIAHMLGRDEDEKDDLLQELELSRATLLLALERGDGGQAATIEAKWRSRLLHLLRSDPSLTDKLRSLPAPPAGTVYNHISGRVRSGLVIQAGRIEGSTFHTPPDASAGRTEA
ncbi:hypothetical protein [Streptosporangium sp. NPDC049304]|uniref:hypothetical protein n=1 Tax=Streptosporangium sp. NPDC049304 TaxID=3154830 RepID=UPI00341DFDCE